MKLDSLIKEVRKQKHLSLGQLSEKTGISKATLSLWERGINPGSNRPMVPSMVNLKKLSDFMGMSVDALVGLLDDDTVVEIPPISASLPSNILPVPATKKVPMLGSVACGEPIYMDEVRGEFYPMDSSIHADFCLKAQGDSMINARICDGDVVFIQATPEVDNGQIAAVAIDDEATLKYFYQYGDTVVLRPANSKYEEMTYSKDELNHIRILGKAVAFQSAL